MAEKLFPCGKDLSRSTTRRVANVQELVEPRVLLLAVKSYFASALPREWAASRRWGMCNGSIG